MASSANAGKGATESNEEPSSSADRLSPAPKRSSRLAAMLRSGVPTPVTRTSPAKAPEPSSVQPAVEFATVEELVQAAEEVEEQKIVPDKPAYLRRQPKRFVHSKPFTHGMTDRATADWLKEHFHSKPGCLVPKGFLCERYEEFCQQSHRKPMNNATLGRFIRGVFPKLETRRLGARQQSRYFYNNLGVRTTSPYAPLMHSEARPSTIRRNRPANSRSETPEKTRDGQNLRTRPINPENLPPYLPGFSQRREAYTQFSTGFSKNKVDKEILKHFDEEGHTFLQSAVERNKDKVLQLIHPTLLTESEWDGAFESLAPEVDRKDLVVFLTSFRAHIGVLGSLFLGYSIRLIPGVMENFWCTRSSSVQIQSSLDPSVLSALVANLELQTLLHASYLHMYEGIVTLFLTDFLIPLDEHVWGILFLVSQRYPFCVELYTKDLPQNLRCKLVTTARAFSQCLRDLLNANHDASYLALLSLEKRSVSVVASMVSEIVQLEAMTCSGLWLEVLQVTQLMDGLKIFVDLSEEKNMFSEWIGWAKEHVRATVEAVDEVAKRAAAGRALLRDWVQFLSVAEHAVGSFQGDASVKTGFFACCLSLIQMIIREQLRQSAGEGFLHDYIKRLEEADIDVLLDAASETLVGQSWWPDFPPPPSLPVADLNEDGFYRALFPDLAGIVYIPTEVKLEEPSDDAVISSEVVAPSTPPSRLGALLME